MNTSSKIPVVKNPLFSKQIVERGILPEKEILAEEKNTDGNACITLSAKNGEGLDALKQHLKSLMGYTGGEGHFTARRRHLDALQRARLYLLQGKQQLEEAAAAELLAEDLHAAQRSLGEITGEIRADELLGHIFSSFCIGK